MPPARSASSAAARRAGQSRAQSAPQPRPQSTPRTRPQSAPRPRRLAGRGPRGRVRWDRVGRIGLLFVLVIVAGLYVQHTLSWLSTRAQAEHQHAIVTRLERENADLARQAKSLNNRAVIQQDARELGMVRSGERPYVMTGLPASR